MFFCDAEELVSSSLCLKFPTGPEEMLFAFQQKMTGLQNINRYILSQVANAEEAPLNFVMP